MPAVTAVFRGDALEIISYDADAIIVTVADERSERVVKVNGRDPDTGRLPAPSVVHLQVTGGPAANSIDLSGITRVDFPALVSVLVHAGAGDDIVNGSAFGDVLAGGSGDDTLAGGPGDDAYLFRADGPDGTDTVTERGGEGSDTVVIGAVAPVPFMFDPWNTGRQVVSTSLALTTSEAGTVERAVVRGALWEEPPFTLDLAVYTTDPANLRLDSHGLLQVYDSSVGWYYNPTTIGGYVHALYAAWRRGDVTAYSSLKANAEWLRDNVMPERDSQGGAFLVYRFAFPDAPSGVPAGWRSGLAVARAATALLVTADVLGDPTLAAPVSGLFGGFDRLIKDGGYRIPLAPGADWYEEYASPAVAITLRVLNGHMYVLQALAWLVRQTHDANAARLLQAGLNGLRLALPAYDVAPLSLYDLYRRGRIPHYHDLHVAQLRDLYLRTGFFEFRRYADAWAARTWDGRPQSILALPAPNAVSRAGFEATFGRGYRLDANGVLQTFNPAVRAWYHDAKSIARYVNTLYAAYRGGDDSALGPLRANGLWLRDNMARQTYGGGRVLYAYPAPLPNAAYGLPLGWRSAETAARAAAALHLTGRVFQSIGEGYAAAQTFYDAAERLLIAFDVPVAQGGYRIPLPGRSAVWFEAAASSRVRRTPRDLSGHLETLLALQWYAVNSGSGTARRLFQLGLNGLSVAMPLYDGSQGTLDDLMLRTQYPQRRAMRVLLLHELYFITGVAKFWVYADRWA